MPAVRTVTVIVLVLVGFFLSVSHAALAQGLDEASELNNRAMELVNAGRYSDAESLYKSTLANAEKALGPDHPDVAQWLDNLAALYNDLDRYADAEPLYARSLAIFEKTLGPDHPVVALSLNALGFLYKKQGRYAEAELLYKRSLAIREKVFGPNHSEVAISLNNLGQLYRAQGRFGDAQALYQQALAIWEETLGPDHPNVATALGNLAGLYQSQGRYADAEPLFNRSLMITEKAFGPNHPDVALSLNNLAALYQAERRYADAEPLFKRALAIDEKALGPDHPKVATALNNLAELYRAQARYADAEPLYKRSLAINEKGLQRDVASTVNNLGLLYEDQGRYADAEVLYQRSLAINEQALGPDHLAVAKLLDSLAEFYRAQARYADAEPLYKRSLAINERRLSPDHPDVALLLRHLAGLHENRGRYSDAEPLYKRSLAIVEKAFGPDSPDVALSLNNLAGLYQGQGRYSDAEPLYKRSLAIYEKVLGPDNPDVAVPLSNLATLYTDQGRYVDAEQLYQRSLVIEEKTLNPFHAHVGASLNNLAGLYKSQGQYADAEALFKRALARMEKALPPDHPTVAITLSNLGLVYQSEGRYSEAERLYKQSLAINEKVLGPGHPTLATALNNLASLYYDQGRYADAEPLFKRALAIDEKALGPDHPKVATALNNLAGLYRDQGRFSEALPIVKRTISQNTASKSVVFAVLYNSQFLKLVSPTQALNASFTVLQTFTSSTAGEAISQLAARFAAGSNELARLVRNDQDLAAEVDHLDKSIIAAISKLPADRNAVKEEQIQKRIDEIKSERDNLQDVFNQQFPDYVALSKPQALSVKEIQALLADDEAIVAVELDKRGYVWVITTDQAEWKELSVNAEDASNLVGILRAGLNPDSPMPFNRNLAHQLYRQVLGPIEDIISHKTRLSFVLDGALTSLPPQVLIISNPDGKDLNSVDWLIRKYSVTVLPSVASLKVLRGEKSVVAAIKPMIGFGDPVFDRTAQTARREHKTALNRSLASFYRGVIADTEALAEALPALPETADELRAIAKVLGAKSEDIRLGEAASVTTVKKEPLANYRVVYFATHALVAGQVEKFAKVKAEPALVLSIPDKPTEEDNGLLTASEVAALKLNADFVVLSACNTAAGDKPGAEALSGLARAFFYAGAKSLVVSHWEVDSEATVGLMAGLFEALKANPHLSHAEALRLSMLRMLANSSRPEWAQPEFWAPFVVVGEPQKH